MKRCSLPFFGPFNAFTRTIPYDMRWVEETGDCVDIMNLMMWCDDVGTKDGRRDDNEDDDDDEDDDNDPKRVNQMDKCEIKQQ